MSKILTFLFGFCVCVPLVSYIVTGGSKSGFTMAKQFGVLLGEKSEELKTGFTDFVDGLHELSDLKPKEGDTTVDTLLDYITLPIKFIACITEFMFNISMSIFGLLFGSLKLVFS